MIFQVYHAWKAKNKKRGESGGNVNGNGANNSFDESMRAPSSIMAEAARNDQPGPPVAAAAAANGASNQEQRYFRIPFVRPTGNPDLSPTKQGQKGWWYAHFDGDWIGRQMEIQPDRSPVLLVAGKDDMQMCELALHETGLTRKRGAEILEHDFEKEWSRNGGHAYVRPNNRR